MASQPGPLTQWPWQKLGNLKYALLVPCAAHSLHKFMARQGDDIDFFNLMILPFALLRLIHAQLWITLSRFKTAKSKHVIVDKSIGFDQVDRESNWEDQIVLITVALYIENLLMPGTSQLPLWNGKGLVFLAMVHAGPIEFMYYWLHRALHHHVLYSRYHSHHHSSIATEPITAVIHPFLEEAVYIILFDIALQWTYAMGLGSVSAVVLYISFVDFMNFLGHCNFELVPKWLFDIFPPLKYLIYTPSYHSLHHTQFRTNYSLFMPFYDYLYGTMDVSSDKLYESSLEIKKDEELQVVHLTHLTNYNDIYHLRFGLSSFASRPYKSKWYLWTLWPLTSALTLLTWIVGTTFTVERNKFKGLHIETWALPKYSFQYMSAREQAKINRLIKKALEDAEKRGAKVISLGLLNQDEQLNDHGALFVTKNHPTPKIVDGTSLAVAVVLHTIPKGTKSVLLTGNFSKMAFNLCLRLSQNGIKVEIVQLEDYKHLEHQMPDELKNCLVLSDKFESDVWLVGAGVTQEVLGKARKGTHLIPLSQFPIKNKVQKDCIHYSTPAMIVPQQYENLHTCENWLPRGVMSAWRVAGIIHALEGWNINECGDKVADIDEMWDAALKHGFLPIQHAA